MTRLTKQIKSQILRNAITNAPVVKLIQDIEIKLEVLAVEIYNLHVSPKQNTAREKINKIIEDSPFSTTGYGIFYSRDYMDCNFGGMRYRLNFPEDAVKRYRLRDEPTYSADHRYSKWVLEMDAEKDRLKQEKDGLRAQVNAVLESCRTLKALQKLWPECTNFLEGIDVEVTTNFPAVVIKDLNAMLGINDA